MGNVLTSDTTIIKIAGLVVSILAGITHLSPAQVESSTFKLTLDNILSHSVNEISVKEADSIKNKVIILDSRAREEFNVSHIKNAQWVGYEDFKLSRVDKIPKETPIIVYCSVGYRSEKIAEKLNANGFKNVYNLYGGIFEWKNQDKPVYNEHGPTDQVHAYDRIWGVWLNKGEKVYK